MIKKKLLYYFILFFFFTLSAKTEVKELDETLIEKSEIIFVIVPSTAQEKILSKYVEGSKIVKLSLEDHSKSIVILTDEFYSAMDPDVSFDGKKILFAGKKKENDRWRIWEMAIDGKNKKQLTSGNIDTVSPLYIGTLFHLNDKLPTRRIGYITLEMEMRKIKPAAIYSSDFDGKNPTRISYNLSWITDMDVFNNGPIIYNSFDLTNLKKNRGSDLLAVNIDGTDNMGYLTNNVITSDKRMVKVGRDGRVYFIENKTDHYLGGGDLSYILENRPLYTHKVLNYNKEGFFHSPCPITDKNLIISFKSNEKANYALYYMDSITGKKGKRIYHSNKLHSIDAQILAPRRTVRGRSTFVNYKQKTGVFYCISSHISQDKEIRDLLRGSIKKVKVFEGFYSKSAGRINSGLLGEAPVENDGSFHIEVPSEKSLKFQLFNKKGEIIFKQDSWTWVMPRESRGCIGCHEDRELAPPNHLSDAIIKPAVKISISNKNLKKSEGNSRK